MTGRYALWSVGFWAVAVPLADGGCGRMGFEYRRVDAAASRDGPGTTEAGVRDGTFSPDAGADADRATCTADADCDDGEPCTSDACDPSGVCVHTRDATCSVRCTVATGAAHACLLAPDGGVRCWGGNDKGQVGIDDMADQLRPVGVTTAPSQRLVAGDEHACVLDADGAVACWGSNRRGQLGVGSVTDQARPVVVGMLRAHVVVAGGSLTCGVDETGAAWCWGANEYGQVGNGERQADPVVSPEAVVADGRPWRFLAAGQEFVCGLDGEDMGWCWGRADNGRLPGWDAGAWSSLPVRAPALDRAERLSLGTVHGCLVRGGQLRCWGNDADGVVGAGGGVYVDSVLVDVSGTRVRQVSAGRAHTCAVTEDGALWCWGRNAYGELGLGDTQRRSAPTRVAAGQRWYTVSAGHYFTCAIDASGALWCWGRNDRGQLGLGDREPRTSPQLVLSAAQACGW